MRPLQDKIRFKISDRYGSYWHICTEFFDGRIKYGFFCTIALMGKSEIVGRITHTITLFGDILPFLGKNDEIH